MRNRICEDLGDSYPNSCRCQGKIILEVIDHKSESFEPKGRLPRMMYTDCHGKNLSKRPVRCQEFMENVWCYSNDIAKDLPDGKHELIVEFSCWTSYDYYSGGYEGVSDYAFKLVKSKSLTPHNQD